MSNEPLPLTPQLRELAETYFVTLQPSPHAKDRDTLQLNLSGYSDVMYLIGDIVKTCLLALEGETSFRTIPEPMMNISGVLGIVLDLIPYEEADLLDKIRQAVLHPETAVQKEPDFLLENIILTVPDVLRKEMNY